MIGSIVVDWRGQIRGQSYVVWTGRTIACVEVQEVPEGGAHVSVAAGDGG